MKIRVGLASTYISWSKVVNCGWAVSVWNIPKGCWDIRMLTYCCIRFAMPCWEPPICAISVIISGYCRRVQEYRQQDSFEKDSGTDCDQRIPCREYRCDYLRGASQTESPYPFDAGNDGSRHGNRCGRYLDQGNYDGETRFYRTGRRHFRLCYCVDREGLTKQITNPLKQ